MSTGKELLILASSSPQRETLLQSISIRPDKVIPPNINEKALNNKELAKDLCIRLAREKALAVHKDHKNAYILAADTVVACGRKILGKPDSAAQAQHFLEILSGRRHHVYGGIAVIAPDGRLAARCCKTLLQFKKLTPDEIAGYVAGRDWEGKAGAYGIQGRAAAFVKHMTGSHSNVVGLSLYDTHAILSGLGYRIPAGQSPDRHT